MSPDTRLLEFPTGSASCKMVRRSSRSHGERRVEAFFAVVVQNSHTFLSRTTNQNVASSPPSLTLSIVSKRLEDSYQTFVCSYIHADIDRLAVSSDVLRTAVEVSLRTMTKMPAGTDIGAAVATSNLVTTNLKRHDSEVLMLALKLLCGMDNCMLAVAWSCSQSVRYLRYRRRTQEAIDVTLLRKRMTRSRAASCASVYAATDSQ